jgi:hypothetical protein
MSRSYRISARAARSGSSRMLTWDVEDRRMVMRDLGLMVLERRAREPLTAGQPARKRGFKLTDQYAR